MKYTWSLSLPEFYCNTFYLFEILPIAHCNFLQLFKKSKSENKFNPGLRPSLFIGQRFIAQTYNFSPDQTEKYI